jgi:hypothetical protein
LRSRLRGIPAYLWVVLMGVTLAVAVYVAVIYFFDRTGY